MIKSIEWTGVSLKIIDQNELPEQLVYTELRTPDEVFDAIKKLKIRGAPAIGIAAVFGLYLGLKDKKDLEKNDFIAHAHSLVEYLCRARPTAVNLKWSLQNLLDTISASTLPPARLTGAVLDQALFLLKDDQQRCEKIGQHGSPLITDGMTVLTHCNTGALATAGIGTALGILYTAWKMGKKFSVMVDETRPLLQGARLTMWELNQLGIPATLITDNMAAYAMQLNKIDLVLVGADRIAANGDVANKIGTYNLAVISQFHRIPFYVAAPLSSFDLQISDGRQIPIEERSQEEVTHLRQKVAITVPEAVCWNPAFDMTPARLISGIITEQGIIYPPFEQSINRLHFKTYQNQEVVTS